jgi:hypothetical protein
VYLNKQNKTKKKEMAEKKSILEDAMLDIKKIQKLK